MLGLAPCKAPRGSAVTCRAAATLVALLLAALPTRAADTARPTNPRPWIRLVDREGAVFFDGVWMRDSAAFARRDRAPFFAVDLANRRRSVTATIAGSPSDALALRLHRVLAGLDRRRQGAFGLAVGGGALLTWGIPGLMASSGTLGSEPAPVFFWIVPGILPISAGIAMIAAAIDNDVAVHRKARRLAKGDLSVLGRRSWVAPRLAGLDPDLPLRVRSQREENLRSERSSGTAPRIQPAAVAAPATGEEAEIRRRRDKGIVVAVVFSSVAAVGVGLLVGDTSGGGEERLLIDSVLLIGAGCGATAGFITVARTSAELRERARATAAMPWSAAEL